MEETRNRMERRDRKDLEKNQEGTEKQFMEEPEEGTYGRIK